MMSLDPEIAGGGAIGPQVIRDHQIGNEAIFLQKFAHQFLARQACFRLDWTSRSRLHLLRRRRATDRPCGQRFQIDFVKMQIVSGLGRRWRKSAAIIGPKWFTQRRIVSYETAIPRSANKSSTSRKLKVNRRYSQIAVE